MKTLDLVFKWIFIAIGAIALVGICCGAWWQVFVLGICVGLAIMFHQVAKLDGEIDLYLKDFHESKWRRDRMDGVDKVDWNAKNYRRQAR